MDERLHITRRVRIPASELSERFSKSSGPGGQHVNTTDSRVELMFDVANSPSIPAELRQRALSRLGSRAVNGVVTVAVGERRSQVANRKIARERLAQLLREAVAPPAPPRKKTKPTRGSKERRLASKRRRAELKRNRARPRPGGE